ncbi:hypothetical protein ACU4IU_00105 [Brevibacterium sp. CSND-B09]|uniref:hypothetical protein n=1 Tax=Brevibacterium sp. CSND-B09 TaxID=3462571 RepID=UPI00406A61A0
MSSIKRLAQEINGLRRLALGHATSPQLANASVDGGDLEIRDGDGNRVGGIGLGDDGGFVIDYSGGPKPPRPRAPKVSADAGLLRVEWDGGFEPSEGEEDPLITADLDLVEIHASMDENFVPDRVQSFGGAYASLEGGSHVIGPLTETGTYYVRLVARSKAGKFSEPSDMAEQVLAIASIDEALTDAWLTGVTAAITADGKNGIWRGPEAPEPDPDVPFKDGDIWFEMNDDGESIPNIYDEATGSWVSNRDARQSAIERVQEELRQDLDAVITDGSGTKNFFRPTAPAASEAKEGDLWFDSSADGKNTPHVFQDGAWVSAADQRVADIKAAQDELRQDLDEVVENGVGTSTHYTPTMPSAAVSKEGDLWFDPSDNNKPYIYKSGKWITVRDSFSPPGAGENVFALLDEAGTTKHAISKQWASIAGFTFTPGALGVEAKVPAGAKAGTVTARLPLTSSFNTAGTWQITVEDTIQSNGLGLGAAGLLEFYSPGKAPTARIVLGVAVPGSGVMELVQPLAIKEDKFGSTRTHSTKLDDLDLQVLGIYPSVYAWSLFLEVTVDSVPGNTVKGSAQLAYAVGGKGIADKAITTGKIAAGAITAESGIIGSIDAGTITVGALNSARIAANSITADKLLIGGGANLLPDPYFADNAANWGSLVTLSSATGGKDGSAAAKVAASSGQSGGYFGNIANLDPRHARVVGGAPYVISAWARSTSAIAVGKAALYVRCFRPSDNNTYAWSSPSYHSNAATIPANEWGLIEGIVVTPDSSVEATIGLYAQAGHNAAIEFCLPSIRPAVAGTLIQDGAITTSKIATGAITAESGIIGSLNAGVITSGVLDAARIGANTITADKVLLGGDRNLIPNGELTSGDLAGWNGAFTLQTDSPEPYTRSASIGGTSTRHLGFGNYPVQPGDVMVFEAWYKANKPDARIVQESRDQAGAHVRRTGYDWTTVTGPDHANGTYPAYFTVPTTWTKVVRKITVPPGVTGMNLGNFYVNHSSGTERTATFYVAGMKLYKQVGATLIENGAISTEHIRTGAITAESGIIGSIDANVITSGKIMGNQIDADAMNGKTITGATIRTASAGARVELTQNGLKQYNSLGATIVDMTSGSFTLQGGSITGSTIKTASSGSRVEITTQGLKQFNSSNEVIAEMVAGSMVMKGVLEQENSVGKLMVGPAFASGKVSPGLIWGNLAGHPTEAGFGVVDGGSGRVAIALQGPGKTSSSRGALLNLFDNEVYMGLRDSKGYQRIDADGTILSTTASTGYNQRFYMEDRKIWTGWQNSNGTIGASLYLDNDGIGFYVNAASRRLMLDAENIAIPTLPGDSGAVALGRKSGRVYYISSARRFKLLEEPITDTVDSFEDRLLSVDAKTWIDKTRADRIADYETAIALGEEPEGDLSDCGGLERIPGVVAEDLEAAGLEMFVTYNDDGETESVLYDRIGPALIPIVRSQRDRIEALESRLEALEAA